MTGKLKGRYKRAGIAISRPSVSYHRNGVAGDGFYVVTFTHEHLAMVAVLFNADPDQSGILTAVLHCGDFAERYRGDVFHPVLLDVIADYNRSPEGV